ncbi:HAD-superfamily subfamily IB hydrolase, TIGR01490 [Methyloglobulus morosus KoM1]|uniref:HAD-superfamily subfamily IB hydrolase, TIGR01490 n=1 Tax=Methyloglobulus morosus KoM1 TaxID=1116472 RepID=V5C6J9_9GAMM|nr:HAD family hydrolase [Methyloglobulus morosus]ESS72388.1 HAD-superfamily subfamily IB hydrolase, TIGR01490 [Methyloglobulus morosus KoM1]
MSLAIFDLDNTLIAGDSDYLWGQFLVDQGIVDKAYYETANTKFYSDYKHGTLNITEFLHFSLKPLADNHPDDLYRWRNQFIETIIKPLVLKPALQLVDKHRERGDTLMVITATNRFVTEPIVKLYGIELLLATTPGKVDGQYTGTFIGIPCFQEGKVKLLEEWLGQSTETLTNSWFYSDSHNDLPLLKRVDNPVAVDPDDKLNACAKKMEWPIISLRSGVCPRHHFQK